MYVLTGAFAIVRIPRIMSSELLEFISSLKKRLGKGSFSHESAVSMFVILPVLKYLGWDIETPGYVCPQYSLENLKVDYGLKISRGKREGLRCIVEVKAEKNLEGNTSADRQLFQYAFLAGAPLAVLTDGGRWRFYLPMAAGDFEERLVRTLDVEKHPPEKVVQGLVDYLSFENTRSGKAKKNAERDHEERIRSIETNKNISKAWENLLDGPSDRLVTLLVDETSRISSGYPPVRADVEGFIKNRGSIETSHGIPPVKKTKGPSPGAPSGRKETGKKPSFSLFGEEYTDEKWDIASAFVKIMEILARRDQSFLGRLAPELEGKKNKPLSQNRGELADYARGQAKRLPGGWWLTTHSSTDVKRSVLRKACKVAGIPYGNPQGLKIINF